MIKLVAQQYLWVRTESQTLLPSTAWLTGIVQRGDGCPIHGNVQVRLKGL